MSVYLRMRKNLAIIAAVSENGVIGRDGNIPWHLPNDLRRFRNLTMGHSVIMGRNTFFSGNGVFPLAGRENLVITSGIIPIPRCATYNFVLDAYEGATYPGTVFAIGGEGIYREAMEIADIAYITMVHATIEGDRYFPPFTAAWVPVSSEWHDADAEHECAYSFQVFRKAD